MQTFLPYPDFARTAAVLDRQRLGKQRVECVQLLNALDGSSAGWRNHPAARMWRGYEPALARYTLAVCWHWTARLGFRDSCRFAVEARFPGLTRESPVETPNWMGDPEFHRSHRSNLIRKDPGHYRVLLRWDDPDDLEYVWPRSDRDL